MRQVIEKASEKMKKIEEEIRERRRRFLLEHFDDDEKDLKKLIPIEFIKSKVNLIFEPKYERLEDRRILDLDFGEYRIIGEVSGRLGMDHFNIISYLTNFCQNRVENDEFQSLVFYVPLEKICDDLKILRKHLFQKLDDLGKATVKLTLKDKKSPLAFKTYYLHFIDKVQVYEEKENSDETLKLFEAESKGGSLIFRKKKHSKNLYLAVRFDKSFATLILSAKQRKFLPTSAIAKIAKVRSGVLGKILCYLYLNSQNIKKIELKRILDDLNLEITRQYESKIIKTLQKQEIIETLASWGWKFDKKAKAFVRIS